MGLGSHLMGYVMIAFNSR